MVSGFPVINTPSPGIELGEAEPPSSTFNLETLKIIARRISGRAQVAGANLLVMRGGMMLYEIVGFVKCTTAPVDQKLALAHAVSDPIETPVDGF